VKIVLCGPPKSGKSVMREGLKQAIKAIQGAPYPYVITACPDGEGAWFQGTMNTDPELAKACKAVYKTNFTLAFVQRVALGVRICPLPLALVDIGGIPSQENKEICRGATHAILIAGNSSETGESWDSRLVPWREFCQDLGLAVIAEILSDYRGIEDKIEGVSKDNIFRGSVHYLERGESVKDRPVIKSLAEHLVQLVAVLEDKATEDMTKMADKNKTYMIIKQNETTVKVGFGTPAQNDQIVKDVDMILDIMVKSGDLAGGEIIKINGPATLPVAMVIAHALGHLYGAVACFDPKLGKYVVCIAHGGIYQIGDLIES
jgi:hypothetical protein